MTTEVQDHRPAPRSAVEETALGRQLGAAATTPPLSLGLRGLLSVLAAALLLHSGRPGAASAQSPPPPGTQVVLLGTGTPLPDPERAGPATAVVVNGTAYLVDVGTGVVRRAAAARDRGVAALEPTKLRIAFVTHLHADHTLGLADLILTPWIMGRTEPLELYGPPGLRAMAGAIVAAYAADIAIRTGGLEHSNRTGYHVNVHEVAPGLVYRDANVTVTAFDARHGELAHAYGYRFVTVDRTVVISGDASARSAVLENCQGCDVLVHEGYTQASYELVPAPWQRYRAAYHTSSEELAALASRAHPGLLVLYHRANPGCDQVRDPAGAATCRAAGSEAQWLQEVRRAYPGNVVAGHDLDVY